jgi:Rrf2 family protein
MRLNLTRQADYAIRAMVWLADHDASGTDCHSTSASRQKAAAIARATGIPGPFAARVLAQLQRAGLLIARAGQEGGYTLARPGRDISLLDVIESVEGPLRARDCLLRDLRCGTDGYCVVHDAWSTAQDQLLSVLASTTLDRLRTSGSVLNGSGSVLETISGGTW